MAQKSAGILMYRRKSDNPEVLLVHPGGPYWAKRDDYAWSIPKGLLKAGEDSLAAARREFEEETGCQPSGAFIELGYFKQPSGKIICAWAVEGDFDLGSFKSNLFSIEWPLKSGRIQEYLKQIARRGSRRMTRCIKSSRDSGRLLSPCYSG
jgi:predicted NUDIX family NTP pyrophosphohydrolase